LVAYPKCGMRDAEGGLGPLRGGNLVAADAKSVADSVDELDGAAEGQTRMALT